jgi:hypothetical protein
MRGETTRSRGQVSHMRRGQGRATEPRPQLSTGARCVPASGGRAVVGKLVARRSREQLTSGLIERGVDGRKYGRPGNASERSGS